MTLTQHHLTPDHALQVWSQSYMQSIQPAKDPRAPLRLQSWMMQAGFVEVESRLLTLPLSGWSTGACSRMRMHLSGKTVSNSPPDPREHAIGTANRANVQRLLSSLAVYPFAHALK